MATGRERENAVLLSPPRRPAIFVRRRVRRFARPTTAPRLCHYYHHAQYPGRPDSRPHAGDAEGRAGGGVAEPGHGYRASGHVDQALPRQIDGRLRGVESGQLRPEQRAESGGTGEENGEVGLVSDLPHFMRAG